MTVQDTWYIEKYYKNSGDYFDHIPKAYSKVRIYDEAKILRRLSENTPFMLKIVHVSNLKVPLTGLSSYFK